MFDTFTIVLLFVTFAVLVPIICTLRVYVFLLFEFSVLFIEFIEIFAVVINSSTFVNVDFVQASRYKHSNAIHTRNV
jgi:hypothetical protein